MSIMTRMGMAILMSIQFSIVDSGFLTNMFYLKSNTRVYRRVAVGHDAHVGIRLLSLLEDHSNISNLTPLHSFVVY